jgi:hypothetical protein
MLHGQGTLYRDINRGYSFDGEDDLQKIVFTDSMGSRRLSSNESSSPVVRGDGDATGGGSGWSGSESESSGAAYSVRSSSTRGTMTGRGATHGSAASMAESIASEEEFAPSGGRSGWFSGWW